MMPRRKNKHATTEIVVPTRNISFSLFQEDIARINIARIIREYAADEQSRMRRNVRFFFPRVNDALSEFVSSGIYAQPEDFFALGTQEPELIVKKIISTTPANTLVFHEGIAPLEIPFFFSDWKCYADPRFTAILMGLSNDARIEAKEQIENMRGGGADLVHFSTDPTQTDVRRIQEGEVNYPLLQNAQGWGLWEDKVHKKNKLFYLNQVSDEAKEGKDEVEVREFPRPPDEEQEKQRAYDNLVARIQEMPKGFSKRSTNLEYAWMMDLELNIERNGLDFTLNGERYKDTGVSIVLNLHNAYRHMEWWIMPCSIRRCSLISL